MAVNTNQFNDQLRANPAYVQYLQSIGVQTNVPEGQPWRLTDQQRKMAEAWVRQNVGDIGNLEIDISGNTNENEGFGKQLKKWGPLAAGGAVSMFGIPGLFPGMLNKGDGLIPSGRVESQPYFDPNMTTNDMGQVVTSGTGSGFGGGLGTAATSAGISAGAGAAGRSLGGGAAEGLGGGLKDFFTDPTNLAGMGAMIASMVGGNREANKMNEIQEQDQAQMRRIAGITEAQMRRTDPLHQVATQLAFGRMPTNYRQGVNLSPVKLPE